MTVTCAWRHHFLQTHQSRDTSCTMKLLQINTTRVSWFSCRACYARRCSYTLGCERWELRHWQQIWQANLMTSHLHLVKKKQTSTPASLLLRGIWKRKLHQTSNAGNESNWEKVCPGSEGCEEVVEREQLLCISGEGMGAVQAPQARKLNWRDGLGSSAARRLNTPEHFKSHCVMSGQRPSQNKQHSHTPVGTLALGAIAFSP